MTRSSVFPSARNRCFKGRRTRIVGDELGLDAEALQPLARKIGVGVGADDRDELHRRAEATGVRGHDPGAAEEFGGLDRRDDDRRVFLRHAERIAIDIFVDDDVADHEHAQGVEPSERLGQLGDLEAVPRRIVPRLADG